MSFTENVIINKKTCTISCYSTICHVCFFLCNNVEEINMIKNIENI